MQLKRSMFSWSLTVANFTRSLSALCGCFRGSVPKHANWTSLLGLANQTLTVTSLMELTICCRDQIPEDVRVYVREMFERNVIRNDRLAAQLAETVAAINDRGVTPILLKGAATLATAPRSRWGAKLMSDLDIVVSPDEVEATLDALYAVGYKMHQQTLPHIKKWFTELERPIDVGMIDLHRALPGPAFFYRAVGDVKQHCKLTPIGRGSAYVPSATLQALILTIHDEFQDSDYWIGNIDMRHLLDLRDLAQSDQGIDWDLLASFTPDKLARNALETQLLALSSLLGVDVPAARRMRFVPRLQFRRRLLQARYPLLRRILLPIMAIDLPTYRDGFGASYQSDIKSRRWSLPKKDSVGFLVTLSRGDRVGKV
jgi:Uncharacterised nucleotidyltransferase